MGQPVIKHHNQQHLVTVLGATGSIGASTLDVISQHPERYKVFALTAHSKVAELAHLCAVHTPLFAVVADEITAQQLRSLLSSAHITTQVLSGVDGLTFVASAADVDIVVAAIVGAAGLVPTLAAVRAGKRILLANKEALVMSGALFMQAAQLSGAELLPIDSEHNAIFQCLPVYKKDSGLLEAGVKRLLLTASGGPFREWSLEQLATVTPEQACRHPNWSMGRKISVDSASMMNKGLELIEACWLFGVSPSHIDVVVHPQSVVHSLVEYIDGSVLAQLGNPDMRTPIAHALAWPERIISGVSSLNLFTVARLDFQAPDSERFPCLRLAREAADTGGTAPAILNAANEVAVDAFLNGVLRFDQIPVVIAETLSCISTCSADDLQIVLNADQQAREIASAYINKRR